MPVFYVGRNVDNITWQDFYDRLSFLFIQTYTCNTDKNLSTTLGCVMNMPVVSAGRFKGNIEDTDLFCRYRCKITLFGEVFCVGFIVLAHREEHSLLILSKLWR